MGASSPGDGQGAKDPTIRRYPYGGRASLAWLLFDFVYYGNAISSPVIIKLVAPHASLIGQTGWALAIFAVAALPGFILAALTIDKIGRKLLQPVGFAVMAVAFACLWLIPGATGGGAATGRHPRSAPCGQPVA
jgi:MFS family permease